MTKQDMKFSVYLFVLLLTISYFTVHSVPIRYMVEEQQPVKVTKRETNLDTKKIDDSIMMLKTTEFAHELANTSLSNYLKDLYVNFSFPIGPAIKDQMIIPANTIRSYENEANSKFYS